MGFTLFKYKHNNKKKQFPQKQNNKEKMGEAWDES